MEALKALPFAHRGLHGGDLIENSLGAFAAAIAAGHGIELDVRVTSDGHAIVFHDATLDRLAEGTGKVEGRTAAELQALRLTGTDETIPGLPDTLDRIDGRVPLLIEVKAPDRNVAPICLAVFLALEGYRGPVGIMSFNPEVGRWFRLRAPHVTRGLVVTEAGKPRPTFLPMTFAIFPPASPRGRGRGAFRSSPGPAVRPRTKPARASTPTRSSTSCRNERS